MTTNTSQARRGVRISRPDSDRFFTIMLVFSQRTFRWSLARKTILWTLGIALGIWVIAMVGSAYGFWATKKIMSFSQLQQETANQQRQLRDTLGQTKGLEDQVQTLRHQVEELMKLINPSAPAPALPPVQNHIGTPPPTTEKISQLKSEIEQALKQTQAMRASMDPIIDRWNHTPSIPPTAGYLSSGFGIRMNPFARSSEDEGLLGFHTGYDISNVLNTPIQVTANGTIETAGWISGYGNAVIVRHTDELETLYGHMNYIDPQIKVGQKVTRGDILGYMGQTGHATGVHLHYEVRVNGKPVDPGPYLRLQREWLSSLR